jgi:hypothetical protein
MLLLLISLLFQAADLSGARHTDAVPTEVAAPVSATIAPGGVTATAGSNMLTFWFVKQLSGSGGAAPKAWADVREGTLVGAVKVAAVYRDIRGRVIKPGVYTLRYGIQPADGDHLGVSPYREFLLLSPAAQDPDPKPLSHDGTVDISKLTIGGSHPAVLSLDPPVTTEAPLSIHTTDLGHKAVVMEVPIAGGTLRFGLVLIGKIEA